MNVTLEAIDGDNLDYFTFPQTRTVLNHLNSDYSRISNVYSLGEDIFALEIGLQNRDVMKGYPAIGFVANLDGNDHVTTVLLFKFAKHLLTSYGLDEKITKTIQTMSIHMVFDARPNPIKNLDTSFPTGANKNIKPLTPDTFIFINWLNENQFVFLLGLRAGSLHVSLPFNGRYGVSSLSSENYLTSDEQILRKLALNYATHHPTMGIGHPNCPSHPEDYFKDGVTNGGLWDSHEGSMMDYSYLNTSTFQLDVYVSCERTPLRSHLPSVWIEHKKSLMSVLNWIDMGIKEVKEGFGIQINLCRDRGLNPGPLAQKSDTLPLDRQVTFKESYVVDDIGRPIANASIEVEGSAHRVRSSSTGAYWRPLSNGDHIVTVSSPFHLTTTKLIQVIPGDKATQVIFKLVRDETILGMPRLFIDQCTTMVYLPIICYYNTDPIPSEHEQCHVIESVQQAAML
uniref:Peptidase M14 domain-containing protein n=1 Tax=Timema bartmani TaxID=61472 RepID=A0A7R9F2T4_9NEOP|nr:unnamed protein product [Timema bartmani]